MHKLIYCTGNLREQKCIIAQNYTKAQIVFRKLVTSDFSSTIIKCCDKVSIFFCEGTIGIAIHVN
jgi:hypothetical protein